MNNNNVGKTETKEISWSLFNKWKIRQLWKMWTFHLKKWIL